MKKIIYVLLIAILSTSTFVACTNYNPASTVAENSQSEISATSSSYESSEVAISSQLEESSEKTELSSENTTTEGNEPFHHPESIKRKALPEMSAENQLVYDIYLESSYANILDAAFSEDDFSNLYDSSSLMMGFYHFYESDGASVMTFLTESSIPADVFESTIQQCFNMSTEDIRKSDRYRSETDSYFPIEPYGPFPAYVVTSYVQDGNQITIDYTRYLPPFTTAEYIASTDGVVVIELGENDTFKYISNTTVALYPQP